MSDPIQDIARQLGIQTFGDGLLAKIGQTIDLLRDAAQERDQLRAELSALKAQQYPLPNDLYAGSKDWAAADYAGRVEWLHAMYESSKREVARLEDAALKAQQVGQEPVAWLIDWPDEPELGGYFSEEPCETGRSRPLYTAPQPAPAQDVAGLVEALRAADEYLSDNPFNEIGSRSILHRQMQDALAAHDKQSGE